ncbi:DNA-binding domain-containing protein [Pseudoduganella sp. LjRoot289]|uniref:HvfC/BufC family peptide modification chaperone n=1 Tax=Pseudoduganella sp. LjRoot289 TaxID=3342314 RepID=UPI003ED0A609
MMLADLQGDFRSWLTSASAGAASRLGGGSGAGLAVYRNNYRAQLVGCLGESYPRLRALVGEERFLHAATAHIGAHPPHAWTLDAYADEFGTTLQALFPHNPDLHELAWIEHALSAAFVAPDAQPLAPSALAAVDWEQARLRFSPTLRLAPLTTNASDIWWALHAGQPAPEAEMLSGAGGVMVWRRGYVSSVRALDALDFEALVLASGNGDRHGAGNGDSGDSGGSFGALCGMLIGRLGEAGGVAKAGALLADWIGSELIIGLDKQGAGHG